MGGVSCRVCGWVEWAEGGRREGRRRGRKGGHGRTDDGTESVASELRLGWFENIFVYIHIFM